MKTKIFGEKSHIFTASTTNPAWSGTELGLLEPIDTVVVGVACTLTEKGPIYSMC